MPDFDSPNHFYLGREHSLATGETNADKPLLYKSKDLTTHAVCVGMTGSGKTGLCLSLLEEAALDGVPAICIDPKGDLGNLLLGFPELRPTDFRPWIDESVAQRKGVTPDAFAEQTAELWRNGLSSWGQQPERITRYNDSAERLIFTPGASHGLPITVLKRFDAPPKEVLDDEDALRERVASSVSGLLGLLGIDADPVRSREHIYLSNILIHAWRAARSLDVAQLIREIQKPPFDQVGVLELEAFFPAKERDALAMDLNNLLASPSFQGWMRGQPLDVQQLFYSPEGKPRHSILSIAHLSDAERMFFVTILLGEVLAWMRAQPGTSSLRALLYMDEVFGYFPPTANPPSKGPMLTLLKQARAFGLGCVLATQNPVDLDYKGLSNAGTWFLGRLQTERDKLRVMEGLEGASAAAGSSFNKQEMERTLAGLGSRVFLMNNVHEDQPVVFHTRWAMSYLAGPLARGKIKELMDPLRERYEPQADETKETAAEEEPEKNAEKETREEQQDETEQPVEEDAGAPRVVVDPKKLTAAQQELSACESDLNACLLQLPLAGFDILYRAFDLFRAMQEKRATTRRTSSVRAAAGRASGRLSKILKARGKWGEAYSEHAELSGASSLRPPVLPFMAWLILGIEAIVFLAVLGIVGSFLLQFMEGASGGLGLQETTDAP